MNDLSNCSRVDASQAGSRKLTDARHFPVAITLLVVLIQAPATAREPAELSAISRSTISIRASVSPRLRVTRVQGEHVPNALPAERRSLTIPLCVAANTSTRMYKVRALTSPRPGELESGHHAGTPLIVRWKVGTGRVVASQIGPGTTSPSFEASAAGSCVTDRQSAASLSVEQAFGPAKGPGSGALEAPLTLLIAPE